MKELQVAQEAQWELEDAMTYYKRRAPRQARDLRTRVERACARLQAQPQQFPIDELGYRRILIEKFPYAIYFRELPDRIWVAAFAHHARERGYWLDREPD